MVEHLQTMSAMVRDLKVEKRDVSGEEQVLNVIWVLPEEPEH